MQSRAADVASYLAEAPPERFECLTRFRQLCREILKGYEEGMEYGMPTYRKGEKVEVAFASQKNYIALYITKPDVVEAHRSRLEGLNVGKGCIRYPKPARVDFAVVESLLRGMRTSTGTPC